MHTIKLHVRWQENIYAIYDLDVEDPDGRLILSDNMWDAGWSRVREDFDGDADAYVLTRHQEAIQAYVETGLTYMDWRTLDHDWTVTIPPRRISAADMARYHTINVHLGKGQEGARRLYALRLLAAEAGFYWNNEPSIGRWLSAVADERMGPDWKSQSTAPASGLATRFKTLAQEQIKMWQALLQDLDK